MKPITAWGLGAIAMAIAAGANAQMSCEASMRLAPIFEVERLLE